MPNYLIQKDANSLVPFTGTSTQADVYARDFTVYVLNSDNSRTLYGGPTVASQAGVRPRAVAVDSSTDDTPTVVSLASYQTNPVTGRTGVLIDGRVVVAEDEQSYTLPPAKVRITATQIVVGKPIGLKSVKCIAGSSVALSIYDNGTIGAGTVLFTQTMSAGDEWSVPTEIQAINGLHATFTGTATFDIGVQDAA